MRGSEKKFTSFRKRKQIQLCREKVSEKSSLRIENKFMCSSEKRFTSFGKKFTSFKNKYLENKFTSFRKKSSRAVQKNSLCSEKKFTSFGKKSSSVVQEKIHFVQKKVHCE